MRSLRLLKQGVWYNIRTRINNREPLFRSPKARTLFARVLMETELRFVFILRGLRVEDDWLTFYLKPEDGLELPEIMKWMKQVFTQRYNRKEGRIGHIWGDRYWSEIVEEVPEDVEEAAAGDVVGTGVRPYGAGTGGKPRFPLIFPPPTPPSPG
ncbi:MAG: transposase [Treponema sp.]|jgi:REP element-mobilizing transposase RayT|nr:transposase [Treponema sp.]